MLSGKGALRLLAGSVWLALASAASAQQTAPTPAPSQTPNRTTTTYADWTLVCDTRSGPPSQKICEIMQVVQAQVQGKNVPFSIIVVTPPRNGQPGKFVVRVPSNATLSTNVRIQAGDADPGIAAPFARCGPPGCFADFALSEDVLGKLRAASGAGKVTYADFTGHAVTVPLSFKGFDQAIDALAKE